jgi:DNA-binding MarR family transcriptional regulator
MRYTEVYQWIREDECRKKILMAFRQPLTARQISRKTGIRVDTCSYEIAKLVDKGLLICLNPKARNSRIYSLTETSRRCCRRLCRDSNRTFEEYPRMDLDWELVGWLCFRHRSAVLRMLTEPMQPVEIRRKIKQKLSHVKISANNTRDIIRLFHTKELVQKVYIHKKAHPRYELTDHGTKLQAFLIRAESPL